MSDFDDRLYDAYLTEMRELENFRLEYSAEHPSAPLGREDPDVRRLVEALGFFAARTRIAGQASLAKTRRRIVRQLIPYLLSPIPPMGVVEARTTGQFSELLELPRGSEIEMRAQGQSPAVFRTLREMRILPVRLGRVDTLPRAAGGYRIMLPFVTPYPRNDAIGELSLFIDFLDDFMASLGAMHSIRTHLQAVSVSFEDQPGTETVGEPCTVEYGVKDEDLEFAWPHPIQRERAFFHLPLMDLFMRIQVPDPPRNWQRFTIFFDVGPEWPRSVRITQNILKPFATPVYNSQRSMAQPIVYDGTLERCPVRHQKLSLKFEVQDLLGVYRVTETGLQPMRSGILKGGAGSYESSQTKTKEGKRIQYVHPHVPSALEEEITISAECNWFQPWFSQLTAENLRVRPYRRNTTGLEWDVASQPVTHHEIDLYGEMDTLMAVLVLQHKSRLDRDDLMTLLAGLGTVWRGPFAPIQSLIQDVTVREVPTQGPSGGGGTKLQYELTLRQYERSMGPLVQAFAKHLGRILDAWISSSPVEVVIPEVK